MTLDAASGAPALVMVLCPGEVVDAVQVAVAATDADGYAVEGKVLWRAETGRPARVNRIVAGVPPPGFRDVVPATDLGKHRRLVMNADVKGGSAGGHGGSFDSRRLSADHLTQYDRPTSRAELLRAARANCSGNPLDALGLTPTALGVLLAGLLALCALAAFVPWWLMRRSAH